MYSDRGEGCEQPVEDGVGHMVSGGPDPDTELHRESGIDAHRAEAAADGDGREFSDQEQRERGIHAGIVRVRIPQEDELRRVSSRGVRLARDARRASLQRPHCRCVS